LAADGSVRSQIEKSPIEGIWQMLDCDPLGMVRLRSGEDCEAAADAG
jgi:hypothetical protein